MFELDDRVALVTGGAGLIGEAVCEALVEQGAAVALVEPDGSYGREAADRLGPDATFYRADVTEEESVTALFEAVTSDHGRLDVLVNCAYPRNEAYGRPFEAVEYDDWRENVLAHLGGYYLTSRAAGFLMADQDDGGSIVNLGSIYGTRAPDFSVYEGLDMTSPVEYAAIKGGMFLALGAVVYRLGAARIDELVRDLEQVADPAERERARDLVQAVLDLHGAALHRMLDRVYDAAGQTLVDELARDDLVGCLLTLHGLHPLTLEARVMQALEKVRPYLASHGGGVELLAVTPDDRVHLRLQGTCHGCPSSRMTLRYAVEEALSTTYDTERVKSEVLSVLDSRLSEMQTTLEAMRDEDSEFDFE